MNHNYAIIIKQDSNKLFIAYSFKWSTKLVVNFDSNGIEEK
jgi:hypothetical protein